MKNNISIRLAEWLQSLPQSFSDISLIVAYSGGRDSHVLLHALQALQADYGFSLSAIHVNHGLQPDAKQWVEHCAAQAKSYNVPFQALALQLAPQKGQSIEEFAREQRYAALKAQLMACSYLLTAHTQDDQAETILLQLLRGAGLKGLAGMAALSAFGGGQLARPLLNVSRADIASYAADHQLCWIEDASNQNDRFARNFLRNQIMPALQDYFPGMTACLARSAEHAAQAQHLLNEYVAVDLATCLQSDDTLSLKTLQTLSVPKQIAVLRAWFTHLQIRSPTTRRLQTICQQVFTAKQDAKLCIRFGDITLRRYQQSLYALKEDSMAVVLPPVVWDLTSPLIIGQSVWQARKMPGQGFRLPCIANGPINVRYRQGGEKCRLAGEKLTRSLKKIYQQLAIPYWQRPQLPLFYHKEELIAGGNAFICEGWQVCDPAELGWVIEKVK